MVTSLAKRKIRSVRFRRAPPYLAILFDVTLVREYVRRSADTAKSQIRIQLRGPDEVAKQSFVY